MSIKTFIGIKDTSIKSVSNTPIERIKTILGSGLNHILLVKSTAVVWSGGYATVATASYPYGSYWYIMKNNLGKSRINGEIKSIKIGVSGVPTAVTFFNIYRKNGTLYDLVFSENIQPKILSSGENTITLNPGCITKEGDMVYLKLGSGANIGYTAAIANSMFYSNSGNYIPGDPADLDANLTSALSTVLTIPLYAEAPMIVIIGDSIAAGHPGHYSGIENSLVCEPENSIAGQLYLLDNKYVYQNIAVGSTGVDFLNTHYQWRVKGLKTKMVLCNTGVNDIKGGVVTKASFISQYTTFLNSCASDGIIPIICKIIPWTAGTNEQMQTRDEWNADLAALVATYTGAICIDFDSVIGKFREGGDVNNLWDIKPEYNCGDNIHLNLAGYAKMAEVINTEIKKIYKFE